MEKICVFTAQSPSFPGVCSQALRVGDFLFIGGVIPVSAATGERVKGGAEAEANEMLDNLESILEAAGASLENIVKVTLYISDWKQYPQVNAVYCRRFDTIEPLPARAAIEVGYIGLDCVCELEAVAVLNGDERR